MQEIIKNQEIFFAILLGAVIIGTLSRMIVYCSYSRLKKATKDMGFTKHKLIKTMKDGIKKSYQKHTPIINMEAYVGKHLMSRKRLGLSLSFWEMLHLRMMVVCIAVSMVGAIVAYQGHKSVEQMVGVFAAGLIAGLFLGSLEIIWDMTSKKELVTILIQDYLENAYIYPVKATIEKENVQKEETIVKSQKEVAATKEEDEKEISKELQCKEELALMEEILGEIFLE